MGESKNPFLRQTQDGEIVTLRDEIAFRAMQGMIGYHTVLLDDNEPSLMVSPEKISELSYQIADAILEARKK